MFSAIGKNSKAYFLELLKKRGGNLLWPKWSDYGIWNKQKHKVELGERQLRGFPVCVIQILENYKKYNIEILPTKLF